MNSNPWMGLAWAALGALVVVAIAWRIWSRRDRARNDAMLQPNIAVAQAGLDELKRQLAAGEITPQAYAEHERDVAASLLESTQGAGPAPIPGRGTRGKTPAAMSFALVVSVVGVAAGGIYYAVLANRYDAPRQAKMADPQSAASAPDGRDKPAHALSDEQLQRMVDEASSQVKANPKDSAAWAMLAHSYEMLGKFAEATKAYAQLAKLLPKDAQVLADYADALAVANGRQLHGEPAELVSRALALDPKNVKALVLAGSAALERSSYEEAVGYWERARSASTDASLKTQIDASINDARLASKGLAGTAAGSAASDGRSAGVGAGSSVAGRVILSDDLVGKAPPDATVFIFARPVSGSRMPVALVRRKVSDLPTDFVLDDSNAMVRDMKLSQLPAVVIGARISKRGDVMPQPGDMQGWSAPVNIGTQGVKLEISEVLK